AMSSTRNRRLRPLAKLSTVTAAITTVASRATTTTASHVASRPAPDRRGPDGCGGAATTPAAGEEPVGSCATGGPPTQPPAQAGHQEAVEADRGQDQG